MAPLSDDPEIVFRLTKLDQADDVAALRLDCVASNVRLRAYYETAGFIYRGDVTVGGAPGQRLDIGPVTVVSRYEVPVGTSRRR